MPTAPLPLLLPLLLLTATAVRGESSRLDLVYRVPDSQPRRYRTVVEEEISHLDRYDSETPGKTGLKGTIRSEIEMDYRIEPAEGTHLRVHTTTVALRVLIDGHRVPVSPPPPGSKVMSVKGYRILPDKTAGHFDKFAVVLPLQPIRVGDSWTYTAPPSDELPVFLQTVYELTEISSEDDRSIAHIEGTTHTDSVHEDRALRVRVDGRATIRFDVEGGFVRSSHFKIRMFTAPLHGEGGRVLKTTATRTTLLP